MTTVTLEMANVHFTIYFNIDNNNIELTCLFVFVPIFFLLLFLLCIVVVIVFNFSLSWWFALRIFSVVVIYRFSLSLWIFRTLYLYLQFKIMKLFLIFMRCGGHLIKCHNSSAIKIWSKLIVSLVAWTNK